jgi:serine/threonine-protein kinase
LLPPATAITDIFPPGAIISDRYRLIAPIAVGGMGAVYRAEHTLMQRRLAVKLLRPELADRDEAKKRFIREAQLCAQLDHPNCVTVYDFGVVGDDIFFLAMEFLEGESMADRLRKNGPLHAKEAVEVTCQVLDALGAAHALGIVHRDVKPANVMLIKQPDGLERVKLLDFGIAKAPAHQSRDETGHTLTPITMHGLTVGTPEYIAPEQALGYAADGRADLYSLGISLFELLTGKLPFFSESPVAIVTAHVNDPPPKPSRHAPPGFPITPELDRVILRSLAKRPDDRFANAAEFRQELLDAVPDAMPTEVSVARRLPRRPPGQGGVESSGAFAQLPPQTPPTPPQAPSPVQGRTLGPLPDANPHSSWGQIQALPELGDERLRPAPKSGMSAGAIVGIVAGVLLLGAGGWYAATQLGKQAPPAAPASSQSAPVEAQPDLRAAQQRLSAGDFEGAISELNAQLARFPKSAETLLLLGRSHSGAGNYTESQKDYFKATDAKPELCQDKTMLGDWVEMLNDKDAKLREGARDLFVSCGERVVSVLVLAVESDERKRVKQESLLALEKLHERGVDLVATYTEALNRATGCEPRLVWVKQLRATKDRRALAPLKEQERKPDSKCLRSEIAAAKKELER